MGANVSASYQKQASVQIQKILSDTTNTVTNSSTNSNTINQTATLNIEGVTGCTFEITQGATNALTALQKSATEQTTEIANQIAAQISQSAKAAVEQKNSGINFGQLNMSVSASVLDSKVESQIATSVQNAINNYVSNSASIDQTGTINIKQSSCPPGGGAIRIDQTSMLTQVASQIVDSIMKTKQLNLTEAKSDQDASATATQTNVGVDIAAGVVFLVVVGALVFIVSKYYNQVVKWLIGLIPLVMGVVIYFLVDSFDKGDTWLGVILSVGLTALFVLECYLIVKFIKNRKAAANVDLAAKVQSAVAGVQSVAAQVQPAETGEQTD